MKDENHVIKNLQKEDKLVRRHKKMWEMNIKFGVLMFKEIREGWRFLEWETLHFCCNQLRGRKRICKFSLYMETKIPVRLNIFDP